jgi:hypothetical protein
MEDLLIYLVVAGIAFVIGWHMRAITMLHNMLANADRTIELLQKFKSVSNEEYAELPDDAIPLEIEQVNGQVFAYNKITGEFLAQGPTIVQAALSAAKRFPGKTFWHPLLEQDSQTT